MGKWLLIAASVLISFGAVMQSLSYFNLIPPALGYSLLLMSAVIISPWVPPLLLFFGFCNTLDIKLSKSINVPSLAITLIVIVSVYAIFISSLMPWFSRGTYTYLGMIGFVFPFLVSTALLFLIKGIYVKGRKFEPVYN